MSSSKTGVSSSLYHSDWTYPFGIHVIQMMQHQLCIRDFPHLGNTTSQIVDVVWTSRAVSWGENESPICHLFQFIRKIGKAAAAKVFMDGKRALNQK